MDVFRQGSRALSEGRIPSITEIPHPYVCRTWEADAQKYFCDARFPTWFERIVPLVENSRREYYTLVE